MKEPDFIGKRYSRWVIMAAAPPDARGQRFWMCECDCGSEKIVSQASLRAGISRSCGCFCREEASKRFTTHGMKRAKEYAIWQAMRDRCNNPDSEAYRLYGARGIKVCERWSKFENFIADMGRRPPGRRVSLDRIDNNKDYFPDNCRWTTPAVQNRNRRGVVNITIGDTTLCLKDWAAIFGIAYSTVRNRVKKGISFVAALTLPPDQKYNSKRGKK